jgi:HD domain
MPGGGARRHLPHAVLATVAVVVLPALAMLPLAPLEGALDMIVSVALAIGLSVAVGSVGSAVWSRRPESKDVVFGDLMLWRWIRRSVAERRMAETALRLDDGSDPLLPALQRLTTELEARDSFMRGHSTRVARHARRIACEMGLDDDEVERIEAAASVHDVGKLFVPHSILAQPGPLTDEQLCLVRRHAEQGAELVAELGDPEVTAMVRHHHERVDGAGYPDGLTRDDIPLGARIIAVADTFDAITSDRPYRHATSRRSAIDVVSEEAGRQLDATVVAAFLDYYSAKRGIAGAAALASAPPRLVGWLAATPGSLGVGAVPIAQGVCAAGAMTLASVCIGGLPGSTPAPRDADTAGSRVAQAAGHAVDPIASPLGADGEGAGGRLKREAGVRRRSSGADPGPRSPGREGGRDLAGQPPATAPSPAAPGSQAPVTSPGATSPEASVVPKPGSPAAPVGEPPAVPLPTSPAQLLDPVVETVDQVLAPAPQPIKRIVEPVTDLLGRTGLTSPAP